MECANSKLLVISNECFSEKTSNGRTLRNFILEYNPENVGQIFLHGTPDFSVCKNYYRVSDRDVLKSTRVFHRFDYDGKVVEHAEAKEAEGAKQTTVAKKPARSCRNMVIRNLIWNLGRWWNCSFDNFLNGFEPSTVLLQAGDCPFMFNIALKIAKRFNAVLVMYNSEGYVLKNVLYNGVSQYSIWHLLLKASLRRAYSSFMKKADYCFYITEYMESCYQNVYPHMGKSKALYTSSSMSPIDDESSNVFTVVYCGNLGVGRVYPLCDVADVLLEVDPKASLEVYGAFVNESDRSLLLKRNNVHFNGTVPYSMIPNIMATSSLLLHCEHSDRLENLRYAFSTKIADCLASGRPFLVYAQNGFPFVQYLCENDAAHVACSKDELREILNMCVRNKEYLYCHTQNAVSTAEKNHSIFNNAKLFKDTIAKLEEENN